jgi:pSer/pThr/pTyr-binding forkhead associated (FHA) protein
MEGIHYQVTVQVGADPAKTYPLEEMEIVIGRDSGSDIVINDPEVSRKHAHLFSQQGGYILEDLGSTNGTQVNGSNLTSPHFLIPGEKIRLGDHVTLVYEVIETDPDKTQVTFVSSLPEKAAPLVEPALIEPDPFKPSNPSFNYSGQVPLNPMEEELEVKSKRIPTWMIILLVAILVIIFGCIGFLFFIDANSLWCSFFPFIAGCP